MYKRTNIYAFLLIHSTEEFFTVCEQGQDYYHNKPRHSKGTGKKSTFFNLEKIILYFKEVNHVLVVVVVIIIIIIIML